MCERLRIYLRVMCEIINGELRGSRGGGDGGRWLLFHVSHEVQTKCTLESFLNRRIGSSLAWIIIMNICRTRVQLKVAAFFLPLVLAAAVRRCRCAPCVTTCGYKYKNVIYYYSCWTPLLRERIKLLHNTVYYSMYKGDGAGERRKRYENKQSHVNV